MLINQVKKPKIILGICAYCVINFAIAQSYINEVIVCFESTFHSTLKLDDVSNGGRSTTGNINLNTILNGPNVTKIELAFPRVSELKPSIYKDALLRTYRIKHTEDSLSFIKSLKSLSHLFEQIEPIGKVVPLHTPNDYNVIWNSNIQSDWALDMINAEQAWDVTKGSPNIRIAIVDSNFDMNHEELINQIVFSSGEFFNTSSCTQRAHGTGVAGIAAGEANNGKGQSSIGYNSKLMLYSGFDIEDVGNAALDGADVINCSFRLFYSMSNQGSTAHQNIINAATLEGAIVVAAAGNQNGNDVTEYFYPASYDNVISVMAVDFNKKYGCIGCSTSNPAHKTYIQNDKVDIAAPGVSMLSLEATSAWNIEMNNVHGGNCQPNPPDGYVNGINGTSLSAPIISGTIGLMLSVNSCLSTSEVEYILETTGEDVYNLPVNSYFKNTYGTEVPLLDAHAAVQAAQDYPQVVEDNATTTGPTLLCNNGQGTYTLSNVPAGVSVNWHKSSNLTIISQGSSSVTVQAASFGNGAAWVEPYLTTDCGNVSLEHYDIWMGRPMAPTTNPSGIPAIQASLSSYVTINVTEALGTFGNYNLTWWTNDPTSLGIGVGGTSATVECIKAGYNYVYVTAANSCGTSLTRQIPIDVSSGGGGGGVCCPIPQIVIGPNPTPDWVDITFSNKEELEEYYGSEKMNFKVIITNMSGEEKYHGVINKNGLKVNLKHAPEGIYLVKVYGKDFEHTSRLLVE